MNRSAITIPGWIDINMFAYRDKVFKAMNDKEWSKAPNKYKYYADHIRNSDGHIVGFKVGVVDGKEKLIVDVLFE